MMRPCRPPSIQRAGWAGLAPCAVSVGWLMVPNGRRQ
jgi:hypothetical protein